MEIDQSKILNKKTLDSIADEEIKDQINTLFGCLVETWVTLNQHLGKMDQKQINIGLEKIKQDEDIFAYIQATSIQRMAVFMGHLIKVSMPLYDPKIEILKIFIEKELKDFEEQEERE